MSRAEQDLAYVQDVVRVAENSLGAPRSIFFIWAAIYFVGFSLYDFAPRYVGAFWSVGGPLGGILSYWIGYRWSLKSGAQSREVAKRHLLHWIGMLAAIFLVVPLAATGAITADVLGKIIVLIAAFGLYVAGIYLVRPYLWIGLALAACYIGLLTVTNLPWTAVGAISGGALLLSGILSNR